MANELLSTKLHMPRRRAESVPRPRLADRIGEVSVTLVSAPAGYGKTTLVSEWASVLDMPVAWVSLDAADSDPGRFWSYTVAALKTVEQKIGDSVLSLLQSPQPIAIESTLTLLLNEIAALGDELALVIEDLHEISSSEIEGGLRFLIEHLPPNLKLVITSRADPSLPLAGLRASGRLTEVRAADLRFTAEEAAAFLRGEVGVDLAPQQVEALEERTEGWAVGLQMAAISMRDRDDVETFVQDFSGSNRFVLDYLLEEVLERQPTDVQDFLLKTSILDRLSGPLCDAVTGVSNGQALLENFERDNLFTLPLDDERRWYRYHYLFAELLQRLLEERLPNEVSELRRRAVAWLEEHNLLPEAINHALAGAEYDEASRLIENEAERVLWRAAQRVTVARWLEALPPETLRSRHKLTLLSAWAKFTTGAWEDVEPLLAGLQRALARDDDAISGEIAAIRSGIAYESGRIEDSRDLAQRALKLIPESNATVRSVVAFQLGLAHFLLGDVDAARDAYAAAIETAHSAGNVTIALMALGCLIQLTASLGHLRDAEESYRRARQLGGSGRTALSPLGLALVQVGAVFRERNDLLGAESVLREGISLCEQQGGMPEIMLEGLTVLARVLHDLDDQREIATTLARADELLAELRRRSGDTQTITSRASLQRARLALAQDDVAGAQRWAESAGLDPRGDAGEMSRDVAVVAARIALAQGRTQEAEAILDRILYADDEILCVEPLVVKAIALEADDPVAARSTLRAALPAAEREGYVRLFVDESEKMHQLLEGLADQERISYARQLLREFDRATEPPAVVHSQLVEPLSERELSILRCMAGGLSNQDIANELYLSVNTVKWHARNLYGKLGVSTRTRAVARGREVGLL